MEEHSIYEQIAARTGGSVYIGVVGPVRTGKSTFIKRLMEQLVLPNIEDPYRRERAQAELPDAQTALEEAQAALDADPENQDLITARDNAQANVDALNAILAAAEQQDGQAE